MSRTEQEIQIEYDEDGYCYATWERGTAIGLGKTAAEALRDLRTAMRFYLDTIIDLKLREPGPDLTAANGG